MMSELVPLFGIVFAVGLPLSLPIVFMVLSYRKRRRLIDLHHAERMAAIERGMELPPFPIELIGGARPRRRSSLLPGLVWLFIGLALLASMYPLAEQDAWLGSNLLGLIPAGIGLAYLIYYLVEGRKLESRLLERELSEHASAASETPRSL